MSCMISEGVVFCQTTLLGFVGAAGGFGTLSALGALSLRSALAD